MNVTEAEVLAAIDTILREQLDMEHPLSPNDGLAAGLDSLSLTVLAVGLEDRFRIRLTEDDAQLSTVADLARVIVLRTRQGSTS